MTTIACQITVIAAECLQTEFLSMNALKGFLIWTLAQQLACSRELTLRAQRT